MLVNNKKLTEELTLSSAIVPTASLVAASSSTLVDMSEYGRFVAVISQGVATTAGVITVSLYESTASTWAGAVATQITASITTGASQTGSRFITIDLAADAISDGKRYVGVYVTKADTASALSATAGRGNARYL
jgi:hypothetical protein